MEGQSMISYNNKKEKMCEVGGSWSRQIGAFVVWSSQLNQIVASYYLFNALIVAGRKEVETTMRSSLLQCQSVSIVAEILWSLVHPKTVSTKLGMVCALLFTLLQAANLAIAFTAPQEGTYSFELAFVLQCSAGLCMIPVAQIGHNYTLENRISPARYRTLATWVASSLALGVLLTPVLSQPIFAISSGIVPSVLITIWLLRYGSPGDRSCANADGPSGPGNGDGGVTKKSKEEGNSSSSSSKPALYVGWLSAASFFFHGCLIGTVGESLIDMAVTLALRNHLRNGRGDLGVANQSAVILSMLLAYWTETRPGGGGGNKAGTFILVWGVCQAFRSLSMDYLQTGGINVLAFFALVFVGRYIGPLGKSAQDSALLKLLSDKEVSGRIRVPATLLWTMRMAFARLERPLCQLILLYAAGLPVPLVSGAFTAIACLGVFSVLRTRDSLEKSEDKKTQ